jgi:hypothetical protein
VLLPTYHYTFAAYVFVPSVFGGNIPTAEFEMISTEMYLAYTTVPSSLNHMHFAPP